MQNLWKTGYGVRRREGSNFRLPPLTYIVDPYNTPQSQFLTSDSELVIGMSLNTAFIYLWLKVLYFGSNVQHCREH